MGIKSKIITISSIVVIGGLAFTACNDRGQTQTSKQIVLEEDVRDTLKKEAIPHIKVEEVKLELPERGHFNPVYYHNGRVYGTVGTGQGMVDTSKNIEDYPVDAVLKDRLYYVGLDNKLYETTAPVFSHIYKSKWTWHQYDFSNTKDHCKTLTIDYLNNAKITEEEELNEAIKQIPCHHYSYMGAPFSIGKEHLRLIESWAYDKDRGFYLYNIEQNKLYKQLGDEQIGATYIPSLDKIICMDTDLKVYNVVFHKDTYSYKPYMDLSSYIKRKEDIGKFYFQPINDEEILVIQNKEEETFWCNGIMTIGRFNFKTHEYDLLFEADKGDLDYCMTYLGEVAGEDTLILDSFKKEGKILVPQERKIQRIDKNQLVTLYKEDIEGEGETLFPYLNVIVSENGQELFLAKEQTDEEEDVPHTKSKIYKRYIFQ